MYPINKNKIRYNDTYFKKGESILMLRLKLVTHKTNNINLGEVCEYCLEGNLEGIQIRVFLKHLGLFYLKPVVDWTYNPSFQIFPEAPGDYSVIVEWKNHEGNEGWLQEYFHVMANVKVINQPRMMKTSLGFNLWVPSEWETSLFQNYEQPVFDLLNTIVKQQWVIYDVGANIGYYSLQFSRLVGDQGHIYCFEANPLCVYFLQANLQENNAKNYDILPGALTDNSLMVNFTINYANSGLGITQQSKFYGSKAGHEFAVQGYCLDDLVETFALNAPNLIKIDVEGAENFVLQGMQRTLQKHRPIILLEVHGRAAAESALPKLGSLNYHFVVINGSKFPNADALLQWFPDSVLQLICYP
jgi:FkbM family methyltransferase